MICFQKFSEKMRMLQVADLQFLNVPSRFVWQVLYSISSHKFTEAMTVFCFHFT